MKKLTCYIAAILIFLPVYYLSFRYNNEIFFSINGFQSKIFGFPMLLLSALADGLFIFMIASAAYKGKKGYFWTFVISFFITTIIVQSLKVYLQFPRPAFNIPDSDIFILGDKLRYRSFPSGHSASAMVLGYFLAFGLKRKWKILIFSIVLITGISRIYIGAHYPRDVTTGFLIAFAISHLIFSISHRKARHASRREYKYNLLIIYICGSIASIGYLLYHPDSYPPLSKYVFLFAIFFLVFFISQIIAEFFRVYRTYNEKKG